MWKRSVLRREWKSKGVMDDDTEESAEKGDVMNVRAEETGTTLTEWNGNLCRYATDSIMTSSHHFMVKIISANTGVTRRILSCLDVQILPSVLWRSWLGSDQNEWWSAGVVICLERAADLHMVQLMPLPLTLCCFTNWDWFYHSGASSPGQSRTNGR